MEALVIALTAFAGVAIPYARLLDRNDPTLTGTCSCTSTISHIIHTITTRNGGHHA